MGLDNLPLSRFRIHKAIGRIVGAMSPGRRMEDRDAGPIVRRRSIDHRHAAAHRSVVPVRVVDEDLIGADDSGDDRDVAGGNAVRALEDEDRSYSRDLAALVAPLGLGPPAAARTDEGTTRPPE